MAQNNQITLEQMDQIADQLISQLCAFKATVADLRNKMAEVSTPALGNGILSEQEIAALRNRRERTRTKKHF